MNGTLLSDGAAQVGYRRLAARVIALALRDLQSSSVLDQKSAAAFLNGSEMLCFWCELAQIRPAIVVAHAQTFVSPVEPVVTPWQRLPVH